MEAWINDLKTSHAAEKAYLLTKISELEKVSKPCERESVESDSCESENASECLPDVRDTAASDPWQSSYGGDDDHLLHGGFEPLGTDPSVLCGGPSLTGGDSASPHQVATSGSARSQQSLVKETSALSCSVPECLMLTPGRTEHTTAFSGLSASANLCMLQQPMVTCVATTSSNCSPTDTPPPFVANTRQSVVPSVGGDLAAFSFGRPRMPSSQAVNPTVVNA